MTQQHHDRDGSQGIPLSAVYRQLDDHPSAEAAGYDPAAAVARLMTRWAGGDSAGQQGSDALPPGFKEASAAASDRHELVLRLSRSRLVSAAWAYAAIAGISAAAAAVAVLVTRLPVVMLAGLAVTAVLVSYGVVLIHRATMHGMTADHGLLLGRDTVAGKKAENSATRDPQPHRPTPVAAQDDEDGAEGTWPDHRYSRPKHRARSRGRTIWAVLSAPVLALIAYASFHAGAASLAILAAVAGGALLALLIRLAIAMFTSERQFGRAFRLFAMPQGHQGIVRRLIGTSAAAIPANLMIFIAAVFLSYGVNAFTTIYAVPGHPVHSFALWCSFASSVVAAALWTALAAKKERIEKATASRGGDLADRERIAAQLWHDSWIKALLYLGGSAAFSILAVVILVFP
jgi:hypothetical protein